MARTRAVLVDLDNTLLDFDRAERLALRAALRGAGLPFSGRLLRRYREVNRELWHRYSLGRMSGEEVARERFRVLLCELGAQPRRAARLGRSYLAHLSRRGDTLAGARPALARLRGRFALAVVTNGYERVQRSRLRAARLAPLLDAVVTSEACGFAKPHPRMLEVALRSLGVGPREAVYVGDDLHTDFGAARAAGVPFCWVQREGAAPAGAPRPRRRVASFAEFADSLEG